MAKQKLGPVQLKWLKDLETTKVNQANGSLYSIFNRGYCCLGRAEKVIGKRTVTEIHGATWESEEDYYMNDYLMSCKVADKLAITASGQKICANWNDHSKLSFKQIAKEIRKNPSLIFSEPK